MSESKHTPGPWVHASDIGQIGSIETSDGVVIAQAQALVGDVNRAIRDANARLIAAAPELLEACEAALAYDAEILKHAAMNEKDPKSWVGCEELDRLYEKWISASRAAIAKAKGEK